MCSSFPAHAAAGPVAAKERIPILDVVRGFALLGILIMNMPGFSTSYFAEADGSHLWTDPVNRVAEAARDMLFSGKFNSMFSLLFGIGFTIQLGRMEARDPANARALYLRRLAVLAVFGVVHAAVFWTGDVLHIYALLGLLLFCLRTVSLRAIYILLGFCLVVPLLIGLLRLAITTPELVKRLVADAQAWEASNNAAYGKGTFIQAAREHAREFAYFYTNPFSLLRTLGFYSVMATTMLLGYIIGRKGWVQRIPELMPAIRRMQWWALGIGLLCAAIFGTIRELYRVPGPSVIKLIGTNAYLLCRLATMCFYVLTMVRLAQSPTWQRRFAPIATAGRMPLTNYLSQTLICTTLFYGWGFGLWGKVGPAAGLLLAIAIFFLIQVPFSRWWLARHECGPLEYVWRRVTYAQPLPRPIAVSEAGAGK
jgi:uncharacterized protein